MARNDPVLDELLQIKELPADLIFSLESISLLLIDFEWFERALPLLTLMHFVATHTSESQEYAD